MSLDVDHVVRGVAPAMSSRLALKRPDLLIERASIAGEWTDADQAISVDNPAGVSCSPRDVSRAWRTGEALGYGMVIKPAPRGADLTETVAWLPA
jgi:hypothetical protein